MDGLTCGERTGNTSILTVVLNGWFMNGQVRAWEKKEKKNKKQETVKEIRKITKADRKISRAERVSIAKMVLIISYCKEVKYDKELNVFIRYSCKAVFDFFQNNFKEAVV